jgi:Raf kinase inhibitor-like YbhB/YbcL family protein
MSLTLESGGFRYGNIIPRRYTCEGDDVSPPVAWSDPPDQTRTFALIMEDPDAPGGLWVHWVLFNVPAAARAIPENGSLAGALPAGATHGTNSWGRMGYGGPCPPAGTHRYFLKLYALDAKLNLTSGSTAEGLTDAMKGHVLGEATLMGRYSRS